jgi:argininosuccinate lyase
MKRIRPRKTPRLAKAWSGRFTKPTAPIVEAFTSSLEVDRQLYPHDVAGSLAHVRALVRARLLTAVEGRRLTRGLERVRRELDAGRFRFRATDEDIHMAIERRLTELVGPTGGKLHTGRSRNDQVALDLRLWLRAECTRLAGAVRGLERALVDTAAGHRTVILPGYTHLQRAQPVLLAHHLLAHREMLARDRGRFLDCYKRADELPLGAGALAGAGFALDRARVARDLGFARASANSLDAVGDRDAALEFLAACAITAVHLSRLGEELVLWASDEFCFVELPDAFATGSSMMPQKKNPDVAELVRSTSIPNAGLRLATCTPVLGMASK